MAKPSQGLGYLLVSTQLASENAGPVVPKADSSWTFGMSSTCSRAQLARVTHFSICSLQYQGQEDQLLFIDYFQGWLFQPEHCQASGLHRIWDWEAQSRGKDTHSEKDWSVRASEPLPVSLPGRDPSPGIQFSSPEQHMKFSPAWLLVSHLSTEHVLL